MTRPLPRLKAVSPCTSLLSAVKKLVQDKIHRLPIIQAENYSIVGMLTYKTVIKHLLDHFAYADTVAAFSLPIQAVGIGTWASSGAVLTTAPVSLPLIQALQLMMAQQVSAIPLIDDAQGKVVDVLTREDVMLLAMDDADTLLDQPVAVLKATQRKVVSEGTEFVTCSPTEPLLSVLEKFCVAGAQHVCIQHPDTGALEGLISLSDLFRFIVHTWETQGPLPVPEEPAPAGGAGAAAAASTAAIATATAAAVARPPVVPSHSAGGAGDTEEDME